MNLDQLNGELIKAHETGNLAQLISLYTTAGDMSEDAGDIDAACFYLTHAYVIALEEGSGKASQLYLRLLEYDRVPVQKTD